MVNTAGGQFVVVVVIARGRMAVAQVELFPVRSVHGVLVSQRQAAEDRDSVCGDTFEEINTGCFVSVFDHGARFKVMQVQAALVCSTQGGSCTNDNERAVPSGVPVPRKCNIPMGPPLTQ